MSSWQEFRRSKSGIKVPENSSGHTYGRMKLFERRIPQIEFVSIGSKRGFGGSWQTKRLWSMEVRRHCYVIQAMDNHAYVFKSSMSISLIRNPFGKSFTKQTSNFRFGIGLHRNQLIICWSLVILQTHHHIPMAPQHHKGTVFSLFQKLMMF